jgi:hypothetical protein
MNPLLIAVAILGGAVLACMLINETVTSQPTNRTFKIIIAIIAFVMTILLVAHINSLT